MARVNTFRLFDSRDYSLLMSWFAALFEQPTVAGTMLAISVVIAAGLGLGALRFRGIGLGVAGVLFTGLIAGALRIPLEVEVLHFLRDAGLILFVFSIGLQIGPGFFASLRRSGLRLNALAASGVILGTLLVALLGIAMGLKPGVIVGVLAGATTNTPSLAAAQAMLADRGHAVDSTLSTAGYALAYPMGVVGTILAMLAARVGLSRLAGKAAPAPAPTIEKLGRANIEITNANLDGIELRKLHLLAESGLVVTRRLSRGVVGVPTAHTRLALGDVLLVVGPPSRLEEARLFLGRESDTDLHAVPSNVTSKRLVVTKRSALGQSIRELDLTNRLGVTISRVSRAGVELAPSPDFRFNFADSVLAVGPEEGLRELAALLGDSARSLDHSHLVPLFVGIAAGVALGSIPIALPGLPGTVKLGLAGGPLVVAILLSRIGRIGPMVCYLPLSANFVLREIGIAIFLACVGVSSGPTFVDAALTTSGLTWFLLGTAVTIVPLLVVALAARLFFRLDQSTLFGVLAGGMTDPPALAFANSITQSEAPGTAYSTVYPLTMLLRIVCIQLLVIGLT